VSASKLLLLVLLVSALHAQAAAKILKVLPQYLDLQGQHAVTPSLYDRDAYQARLRQHPEQRSGLRFAVQWKGPRSAPLRLRVELRGGRGEQATSAVVEESVQGGWFSHWSMLKLRDGPYKDLGELVAWRVTLWQAGRQMDERRSFLW
jgi:hypothetical protein